MIRSVMLGIPEGGVWAEDPPLDPPSNASVYQYGDEMVGVFLGLQWVNGDATAHTQWAWTSGSEPSAPASSVAPGVTSVETGQPLGSAESTGWVRHIKGAATTAWVEAA